MPKMENRMSAVHAGNFSRKHCMVQGRSLTHCMCFPLGHYSLHMDPALTPRTRTQTGEAKGLHYSSTGLIGCLLNVACWVRSQFLQHAIKNKINTLKGFIIFSE